MPSASAMSASVCLISSLSSGGSGLGKPGGKRGSLLTVSLLAFALIAGLIVSLNVDNQDAQSDVSVITPPNTNTSVDNRSQHFHLKNSPCQSSWQRPQMGSCTPSIS
jgi:hypothetical protein